jgi:hypothetical protein
MFPPAAAFKPSAGEEARTAKFFDNSEQRIRKDLKRFF